MSLPLDETLQLISRRLNDCNTDVEPGGSIRDNGANWLVRGRVVSWTGETIGTIEAESYSAAKALELVAQECAGWTPAAEDAA